LTFDGFSGGFYKGQRSTTACVAAQSSLVHTVTLGASNLGRHNISATVVIDNDKMSKELCGPEELEDMQ
jgi:hypothetical protein